MNGLGDLLKEYNVVKSATIKEERKALLQELVDKTGYSIGRILKKTKGRQSVPALYKILAEMKQANGENDRHNLNKVLFTPHH